MSSSPDPAKVEANVFQYLDAQLNSKVLYALLYGIYTGILAVTLWNIFINKCWPIRRALVVVVILLHALTTVGFAAEWQYLRSAFIDNGQNFMTIYLTLNSGAQAASWVTGIAASITSILADLILIWYCWMIWGRRWLVVLLPVLFLISAIVSRITETYREFLQVSLEVFPTFYISFTLGTTLSCTLLIVCRILTVAGTKRRTEGRLGVYRRFVEVLVESSAIYSISLILYLAFTIHNDGEIYYLDVIAAIAKGIAPTLLVGRVTAGRRARPGDSWQGSVMASASIRSQSQDPNRTSFQEDGRTSLILDGDLEAQREMFVRVN
ncbi:uncharacterized protein BT62DRAFT_718961 [Guyanagaster necrorhizus]|uniref:Uncharacterized protein n=1 Tax=Guyanagaster necrorhizus TaxID=856835 RepID=A0A9P7VW60_9AGAR|nr:uncharacterized protein BT62DRAFT_718961 [Guyanagaster necrorhizus MCA 3950]KAG7448636.1 hypothetical protein BT62DRAFT_718961 [Guyanagaster necrorhizus MCA 3950]